MVAHAVQMQLDFAAMEKNDPRLLTLKEFVMSSNQAPQSPSDILSLLQAFAAFKQGGMWDLSDLTGTPGCSSCMQCKRTSWLCAEEHCSAPRCTCALSHS